MSDNPLGLTSVPDLPPRLAANLSRLLRNLSSIESVFILFFEVQNAKCQQ